MGDYTLTNYRDEVRIALGNLVSTDPFVTDTRVTRAINHAVDRIIRAHPDLFPEHNDKSFTFGPTIVGDSSFALNATCLAVDHVRHSDSGVITGTDWNDTQERVVSPSEVEIIGLLAKSSTQTGYPSLWARDGANVMYWPTTRTGYTTYIRYYGLSGETYLSATSDTFSLHKDWDQVIVLYAAADLAIPMGQTERSANLLTSASRILDSSFNVQARKRRNRQMTIGIAGMPR